MIFKQWCDVANGNKTQTRRVRKDGEFSAEGGSQTTIATVRDSSNRLKWQVGRDYAVQSERTGKGLFKIKLTEIRLEPLRDISHADIGAEGIKVVWPVLLQTAYLMTGAKNENELKEILFRAEFSGFWNHINDKPGSRWDDNPFVWVLTFKSLLSEVTRTQLMSLST